MAKITLGCGIALILVGVIGYAAAGAPLIPAAIGFLFLSFAIMARNEQLRTHAMHAAAVVGLLGFLGSMGGIWQVFNAMGDGAVDNPEAVIARALTALICLTFVLLAVKSFAAARLLKKDEQAR